MSFAARREGQPAAGNSDFDGDDSASTSTRARHLALDEKALAPFQHWYDAEQPQLINIQDQAVKMARLVFANNPQHKPNSWQLGSEQKLPNAVSSATSNYLACAFSWSVAYTNEMRKLRAEATAASDVLNTRKLVTVESAGASAKAAQTTTTANSSAPTSNSNSSVLAAARLRMARPSDVGHIMGFIRELAEYEREPEAVITDELIMLRDGFTPGRQFHCIMCEVPADVHAAVLAEQAASASQSGAASSSDKAEGADVGKKRPRSDSDETVSVPAPTSAAGDESPALPAPGHLPSSESSSSAQSMVPIAFAVIHPSYSTWEGRTLYIEDLYVGPLFRRFGLSGLFFTTICRAARVAKCARVQWTALNWNTPAINAYVGPRIQAIHLSDWNLYRLYKDGIARVSDLPMDDSA